MVSDLETYAASLPRIYRDLLQQFPISDPYRTPGSGLALPTLYAGLMERYREQDEPLPYSSGMVREACLNMARKGVVDIRNEIFAYPSELGEELIAIVSGREAQTVEPFPSPPTPPGRSVTVAQDSES